MAYSMRMRGMKFREIGSILGVSRERAFARYKKVVNRIKEGGVDNSLDSVNSIE